MENPKASMRLEVPMTPWAWPLDLEIYDRTPALASEEQEALATLNAWASSPDSPFGERMADVLLTPGSQPGLPRCTTKGIRHAGRDTVLERTTRGAEGRTGRAGAGGRRWWVLPGFRYSASAHTSLLS
jgi:hypothetical protein